MAVLLDPANNWIEQYLHRIADGEEEAKRYSFVISHRAETVAGFDVVLILGYTKVLGRGFLSANRLNLVVHESDLPRGKGFSPVQWQVLEGRNEIPVLLVEATENVDSGAIFGRGVLRLDGYELLDQIRAKQAAVTIDLIREFLAAYPQVTSVGQQGAESFYRRRTVADDELDVDATIREQFNHFRVANNEDHPLHFTLDGHRYHLKIYRAGAGEHD